MKTTTLIYVTPLLSLDEAKASMKPMTDFIARQNGTIILETLPSWNTFFVKFVTGAQAVRLLVFQVILLTHSCYTFVAGFFAGGWSAPYPYYTLDTIRELRDGSGESSAPQLISRLPAHRLRVHPRRPARALPNPRKLDLRHPRLADRALACERTHLSIDQPICAGRKC